MIFPSKKFCHQKTGRTIARSGSGRPDGKGGYFITLPAGASPKATALRT
jgi:hypothetical protein